MAETMGEVGARVEWTDSDAVLAARRHPLADRGRLADLLQWLAATSGSWPPPELRHPRLLTATAPDDGLATTADDLEVGVSVVDRPADPSLAFGAGVQAVDDAVDAGADLLVVADDDRTSAAAVLVALLTGSEPVALLPRGRQAVDTGDWITRAERMRDSRRTIAELRGRPDDLLTALDSPALAFSAGVAMASAARRTPLVIDGTSATAAAVLCYDTQTRARRWWQIADVSPDPVHVRAVDELGDRPILDLGTTSGDGTAGLACVPLLRAAIRLAA